MKIPGIQYGQVQSMGRQDINAPMREANAAEQASSAWSNTLRQGLETSDAILDDIAIDKNTKAMNIYNEKKLQWQADNAEMTADERSEAIESGDEVYNTADEAARAAAGDAIGNDPRAQLLFDKDADRVNVQYGANWNSQVIAWNKDEQLAQGNALRTAALQRKDFDEFDRLINVDVQRGVISQVVAEKMIVANDMERANSIHNTSIASAETLKERTDEHDAIDADIRLSDAQRVKKHDLNNNTIIEKEGAEFRVHIQSIVDNIGIEDGGLEIAVKAGEKLLYEFSASVDYETSGLSTEKAQHASRVYMDSVLNEFKRRLTEKTGVSLRKEAADRGDQPTVKTGTPSHKAYNDRIARDIYGHTFVGSGTKLDMSNGWDNNAMLSGTTGAQSNMVAVAVEVRDTGVVDNRSINVIDAGLASGDKSKTREAVRFISELYSATPNTLSDNMNGNAKIAIDIFDAVGPEETVTLILDSKSRSKLDESSAKSKFEDEKYDTAAFETVLEKQAPYVGGGFLWMNTSPKYKESFKRGVEKLVPKYMAMLNGNVEAAYRIAINRMLKDSNVDQTLGRIVEKPFSSSVRGGEIDGGKMFHDDIKASFENNMTINGGETPDYTYYPAKDFDALNNPAYIVLWASPEGEMKVMGYTANMDETDGGKSYLTGLSKEREARVLKRNRAKMEELARSNPDAYANAPLRVKAALAVSVLEKSAGDQLNRGGAAASALGKIIESVGGAAYEVTHGSGGSVGKKRGRTISRKAKAFSKQAKDAGIK